MPTLFQERVLDLSNDKIKPTPFKSLLLDPLTHEIDKAIIELENCECNEVKFNEWREILISLIDLYKIYYDDSNRYDSILDKFSVSSKDKSSNPNVELVSSKDESSNPNVELVSSKDKSSNTNVKFGKSATDIRKNYLSKLGLHKNTSQDSEKENRYRKNDIDSRSFEYNSDVSCFFILNMTHVLK